jgi:membrane protease YdiL (CAAX protease family)
MIEEESRRTTEDTGGEAGYLRPHPPGMALPRTIYVWLTLLILGFVAPLVMERHTLSVEGTPSAARREALSAQDFERYADAERATRSGFADDALLRRPGYTDFLGGRREVKAIEQRRQSAWKDALETYQRQAKTTNSPNVARRILIMEHALGQRLSESVLTVDLPADLRATKKRATDIAAEVALWRALYGGKRQARPPGAPLPAAVARVRGMRLRFLEDRVLADLYRAYGNADRAAAAQRALDASALDDRAREVAFGVVFLLAFVVGLGFLIYFGVHAYERRWSAVGRYTRPVQLLGYGDLADVFVFYFAMLLVLRPVTGLLVDHFFKDASIGAILLLMATAYLTPAVISLLYLLRTLRRRGATVADIGLVSHAPLGKDVVYGVAGYLATLPITLGLGAISRYLFRHDPNVAPNPIMPLIAADRDPLGRLVIFLLAAVAAPFFEELFFRGVLYTGLRTRFRALPSVLLSAVLFAVGHPIQDWIPILGLGVVFAVMREMRQSLVPSIIAHCLQNGITFLALSLLFGS